VRDFLPARHRTGHLRHLMLALEKPAGGHSTRMDTPFKRLAEIVRKRGLVMAISDFLAPLDRFIAELTTLAACGHEVIVFQVLDPAELGFTFETPTVFQDLESGRSLFIDPLSARKEYQRRLQQHCAELRRACQRLGAAYHQLSTSQPLETALFDFLRERMQRRRSVMRAASVGTRGKSGTVPG
ncbi:MAG: DUF58 domain-containing protein, partial [Limisphaerales bacterium]